MLLLEIEVVYALPTRQSVKAVRVQVGTTVHQAIQASGIEDNFPQIDLSQDSVGIFSQKVELDHVLNDGDRVEIYRPLQVSPKEARRLRAKKKRAAR